MNSKLWIILIILCIFFISYPYFILIFIFRMCALLVCSMTFPVLIPATTISGSLGLNSDNDKPTSESIRDKFGLRSNLLSCLTKMSSQNGIDCEKRDKGCCLLIKLSQQRKNAIKQVKEKEYYINNQRTYLIRVF